MNRVSGQAEVLVRLRAEARAIAAAGVAPSMPDAGSGPALGRGSPHGRAGAEARRRGREGGRRDDAPALDAG
jgi:hypothetical protein